MVHEFHKKESLLVEGTWTVFLIPIFQKSKYKLRRGKVDKKLLSPKTIFRRQLHPRQNAVFGPIRRALDGLSTLVISAPAM